jgi:hypothetical protein
MLRNARFSSSSFRSEHRPIVELAARLGSPRSDVARIVLIKAACQATRFDDVGPERCGRPLQPEGLISPRDAIMGALRGVANKPVDCEQR